MTELIGFFQEDPWILVSIIAVILFFWFLYRIGKSANDHRHTPDHRFDHTEKSSFHEPSHGGSFLPPERQAGQMGEKLAEQIIQKVLRPDDILLTNVQVDYDGKETELDNVIINRFGVFIIEVKYYKGELVGEEDDFEWDKYKDDGYGNVFEKKVKNPIKQVKRQIYILAKHLSYYGADVWVKGYAMLLFNNSPVQSSFVLTNLNDIDHAIHTVDRKRLNPDTIRNVRKILTS